MKKAWGKPWERNLEQIEIIDIEPEEVVRRRWSRFIHTHHFDYRTTYFDSVLAHFPRRTGESFMHQFLPSTRQEAFQERNTIRERFGTREEMWSWFTPLINAERDAKGGCSSTNRRPMIVTTTLRSGGASHIARS
jgi:hypothetical protein